MMIDSDSNQSSFAVIASLIDWNSAFQRQWPKLGVESFKKDGVRGHY